MFIFELEEMLIYKYVVFSSRYFSKEISYTVSEETDLHVHGEKFIAFMLLN